MLQGVKWYVVHTYSGYENKVKANIEKIVENRDMQDQILEVAVPIQEQIETKNGKQKTVLKKIYPGYVLIKMIMNDETWYIVRNTRGVTSFVGPGSKPVALSDDEVSQMGIERTAFKLDFVVGDSVIIIKGAFEGSIGLVDEINVAKRNVVVNISIFGRETPVTLEFDQIKRSDIE